MGNENGGQGSGENQNQNNGNDGQQQQQQQTVLPEGWEKIFPDMTPDQARKAVEESRKWERRSKENAAAAQRLAEIEEASKTAEQKAAEELAAAKARAEELEAKYAAASIASTEGIPTALLVGPETRDEDGLKAFAKALKEWKGETQRRGPDSPREGYRPDDSSSNKEAVARQLLGLDQ